MEEDFMFTFIRLLGAECLKLRRSAALSLVWMLPLVFLAMEFLIFERPALSLHVLPAAFAPLYDALQIKTTGAFWVGFFHPMLLALLPALLYGPEHRFKQWRHLHAMPVPRSSIFLAKALMTFSLCAATLGLIWLGLWLERNMLAWINPLLRFPFHGFQLATLLGWVWLGSLPLLALYLWTSDRINSRAVPIVFGLLGTLMTIALSGQELAKSWQRDLNPWVLPYACAQQAIGVAEAKQTFHAAAIPFAIEPNTIRLPSGRKVKTWQNIPDEVLFPPPAPTPRWLLVAFSVGVGMILLGLGSVEARRSR